MGIIDVVVLVLYFGIIIGIGIWSMKRVKGQEDYFMGGRGFGKLLQTFAAFGAGTGADEPVRVGSTAWKSGLSGVWSALMWLFVTPVYWITAVWYRRMRHITLGDWFVERYESKRLGAAYALFALIFYSAYLSGFFAAIANTAVPLLGTEQLWGVDLKYILIPTISLIVIAYGVLGGLTAAYWTDLLQGMCIIVLSILLIPFGLSALVEKFGDPETMGIMEGFTIMHDRVSPEYFNLFGGPSSSEFPVGYIISLSLIALVGIVVQPHFIATGGGSAKSEDEARIGLVVGNFLKRFCTVGWAITALIALALLAGNAEIAANPDRVWGIASREILGPIGFGLVGLMLACLLAAMMSSADCYMIVLSGVIVRNFYAPFVKPDASDGHYVNVARLTGIIMIVAAATLAMTGGSVFGLFKMAIELPILFAAPFWIGMFWRRANRTAVWITVGFSLLFFFILPPLIPAVAPALRTAPGLAATTQITTTTFTREATAADVARHEGWAAATADANTRYAADPDKLDTVLAKIGEDPPFAAVGDPIEITTQFGGKSIFWKDGIALEGDGKLETVSESNENGKNVLVQRQTETGTGTGSLKIDFLLYRLIGIDLSNASKATLETLRLPPRLLFPFLVLIIASFLTPRNSKAALDRYYAKMKTVVDPDPVKDAANLEAAYANPESVRSRKLFPNSDIEIGKPRPRDIIGFLLCCLACFLIIQVLLFLANIGA